MDSIFTKVGTTSTGCIVYLLRGVGYWVCPSHVWLQLTKNRLKVWLRVYGKSYTRGFLLSEDILEGGDFPKEKFEEAVTKLHALTPYGFYLGKFREHWLLFPDTMVVEWQHDSRYSRISLAIPNILNARYGETHHISFFRKDNDDHRKAVAVKAHEAALFTRDFFKEKYKRPIYDVFRYTATDPTTRDTTRTDNIEEFNRRLSEWCLSIKHSLPIADECKGQGVEGRPGDTRALIQALTGIPRRPVRD